jgi:hypothetical protein
MTTQPSDAGTATGACSLLDTPMLDSLSRPGWADHPEKARGAFSRLPHGLSEEETAFGYRASAGGEP